MPIGLYIEDGHMEKSANTHSGAGNFHMKPNGIFWVEGARAGVTETQRFLKERLHPAYATQSGPMLVVGGRINPRIHETGTSMKIRNGVGVRDGHIVAFAISNQPVTFHAFASSLSRAFEMSGRAVPRRLDLGALCAVAVAARSLPPHGADRRRRRSGAVSDAPLTPLR